MFVAQWCQPNVEVSVEDIGKKLDNIADEVKAALRSFYPEHPLFKVKPFF